MRITLGPYRSSLWNPIISSIIGEAIQSREFLLTHLSIDQKSLMFREMFSTAR